MFPLSRVSYGWRTGGHRKPLWGMLGNMGNIFWWRDRPKPPGTWPFTQPANCPPICISISLLISARYLSKPHQSLLNTNNSSIDFLYCNRYITFVPHRLYLFNSVEFLWTTILIIYFYTIHFSSDFIVCKIGVSLVAAVDQITEYENVCVCVCIRSCITVCQANTAA